MGNKLHILSPISDKSSQEPASETSDNNRNNNSQKGSPEDNTDNTVTSPPAELESLSTKPKRRTPQNKNLVKLSLQASAESEIQGSDSGISMGWCAPDLADLPFDMPKLRRRRMQMQADAPPGAARSSDASSVDLGDLPFDMPKLRRRIRASPPESSASSSQSVRHSTVVAGTPHTGLTLNLGNASPLRRPALSLDLAVGAAAPGGVDLSLPLERQGWYHGALSRIEAENVLRVLREGSYLVRNSESTRHDYSLSLKSARGFMHMRIQRNKESGKFILGQFSKPFDNIPEMIQHYSVNQLPIRGAEHMCLLHPVIEQLL